MLTNYTQSLSPPYFRGVKTLNYNSHFVAFGHAKVINEGQKQVLENETTDEFEFVKVVDFVLSYTTAHSPDEAKTGLYSDAELDFWDVWGSTTYKNDGYIKPNTINFDENSLVNNGLVRDKEGNVLHTYQVKLSFKTNKKLS